MHINPCRRIEELFPNRFEGQTTHTIPQGSRKYCKARLRLA